MSKILASIRTLGPIPGRSSLKAKLYPNGEVSIWKEKTYTPASLKPYRRNKRAEYVLAAYRLFLECPQVLQAVAAPLGSSPLPNFDSLEESLSSPHQRKACGVTRYGRNGITSYGARRVRNGCHVLEKALPKRSAVFSTCTVPDMPIEDMARLHQRWHKVVDAFRRKLRRHLRHNGLSGESVTVSEVQTKRYERTGVPVLHIHTVFHGRLKTGGVAVTTEAHDQMWADALMVGVCGPVPKLRSACNLQWIKKSAEGYLGKYMSKGTKVVRELCETGFEGWLPKQWWSMSRTLAQRVDDETRNVDEFAEWLNDVADVERTDIWEWFHDVRIEMRSGDKITIARFGKLTKGQTAEIMAHYQPSG